MGKSIPNIQNVYPKLNVLLKKFVGDRVAVKQHSTFDSTFDYFHVAQPSNINIRILNSNVLYTHTYVVKSPLYRYLKVLDVLYSFTTPI